MNPLQASVASGFLVAVALFAVIFTLTRGRGSWMAPLVAVNAILLALQFVTLAFVDLPALRVQVIIQRALELPFLTLLSGVCAAQAGLLSVPGRGAQPFAEVVRRPRIRKLLAAAPAVLFSAWLFALVAEFLWPAPLLDVGAQAPARNFYMMLPASIPTFFYLGLLGWLFVKASGSHVPTKRLRIKNVSFSTGFFGYMILNMNVVAQMAVAAFLPDGKREAVTATQLVLQDGLMVLVGMGFLLALCLTAAPTVDSILMSKVYPAFLRMRELFEVRCWQLLSVGKVKRVERANFYASEAGEKLGMSRSEISRATATLELVAILNNPSIKTDELTPLKARELLRLQRQVLDDNGEASDFELLRVRGKRTALAADPLHDALEAALLLVNPSTEDDCKNGRELQDKFAKNHWFTLAVAACVETGIIDAAAAPDLDPLTYQRTLRACEIAREWTRRTTALREPD